MTCCTADIVKSHAQGDAGKITRKLNLEEFLALSTPHDDKTMISTFTVPDMRCAACIQKIEKGIGAIPMVLNARANLSNRSLTVVWDVEDAKNPENSPLDIGLTLEQLGYENHLLDQNIDPTQPLKQESQKLLFSLAVAGFAASNIMLLSVSIWSGTAQVTTELFHLISGLIAAPAVLFAGRVFFKSAISALKHGRLNMDVPISLAVLLTLILSIYESITGGQEAYFDASVTLLFFLLIGRYLDHKMRIKAQGAVERLSNMASKGASCIDEEGNAQYILLNEINEGMKLRIFPGERIPVNGKIIAGESDFDKSLITGESDPVQGKNGDLLEAGLLNLSGTIDMIATSTAKNSYLAEIKAMMEAAQQGRGQYVRIAERMASIYAPAVHILSALTFLGWMIYSQGNWHTSIYTAVAVLIITCPCALGLAVPVTHVVASSRLFSKGIMMRDGSALERMAEIDAIFFDKTGTLTLGAPSIIMPQVLDENSKSLIHELASRSSHPLSKAISKALQVEQSENKLEGLREIAGFGIEAKHEAKHGAKADKKILRLGRPSWVLEISTPHDVPEDCNLAFAQAGQAPIFFKSHDALREGAKPTIERLKAEGLAIKILSGDRATMVENIAQTLKIENFYAALTPQEKITHVEAAKAQGHNVMMVGDGVNDAPALAAGHVSMAPASASDVGRLASDLIFTRPNLDTVHFAWQTALQSKRIIKQNFGLALAYNAIAIPLAITGQITPLIAAIAMSLSSIVVVANSLRLNFMGRHKKDTRNEVINVSTSNIMQPVQQVTR
jgi:Cu2+-exporting ATPase